MLHELRKNGHSQCYQESPQFAHAGLRRSAAQFGGTAEAVMRA
jgi:hypothetical protein